MQKQISRINIFGKCLEENRTFCDNCKEEIRGIIHESVNIEEHECIRCKRARKSRYDDYVDPANMYH